MRNSSKQTNLSVVAHICELTRKVYYFALTRFISLRLLFTFYKTQTFFLRRCTYGTVRTGLLSISWRCSLFILARLESELCVSFSGSCNSPRGRIRIRRWILRVLSRLVASSRPACPALRPSQSLLIPACGTCSSQANPLSPVTRPPTQPKARNGGGIRSCTRKDITLGCVSLTCAFLDYSIVGGWNF